MPSKQKIQADIKEAMKRGDQQVVGVLRMVVSAMNAKEKEKRYGMAKEDALLNEAVLAEKSALNDDEAITVISSEIKKRKDAIALYEKGGRPELAESEQQEIEILKKYLPEQLSAEELQKLIETSMQKTGAKEMKDMGRVMADLMPRIKGKADTGEVSKIIKSIIGK